MFCSVCMCVILQQVGKKVWSRGGGLFSLLDKAALSMLTGPLFSSRGWLIGSLAI